MAGQSFMTVLTVVVCYFLAVWTSVKWLNSVEVNNHKYGKLHELVATLYLMIVFGWLVMAIFEILDYKDWSFRFYQWRNKSRKHRFSLGECYGYSARNWVELKSNRAVEPQKSPRVESDVPRWLSELDPEETCRQLAQQSWLDTNL